MFTWRLRGLTGDFAFRADGKKVINNDPDRPLASLKSRSSLSWGLADKAGSQGSLRNRLYDVKHDESADIPQPGEFYSETNEKRSFMISFVNGPQGNWPPAEVSLGEATARGLVPHQDQSPIKATPPTKPMPRIYYVLSNCGFLFSAKT